MSSAFTLSYLSELQGLALDATSSIATRLENQAIPADYTSKMTFLVPANTELSIPLPAINSLVAISVQSDKGVDVSLKNDVNFQPQYTNLFSLHYCRYFGITGTIFDHVKIKCNASNDAQVTLLVAGLHDLPPA